MNKILIFLLLVVFLLKIYNSIEPFNTFLTRDKNSNQTAKVKNVNYSSNIPGVDEPHIHDSKKSKSLEFTGDSSILVKKTIINNQFTTSFYIKTSTFVRFPKINQILLIVSQADVSKSLNKIAFVVYLDENKKLNLLEGKYIKGEDNEFRLVANESFNLFNPVDIKNDWVFVAFGKNNNSVFLQVNDKRVLQTVDVNYENELTYLYGNGKNLIKSTNMEFNNFKGLLGNIKIHDTFLSSQQLCSMNKYCGNMLVNYDKCMFKPEGNRLAECISKCDRQKDTNNCSTSQCINACDLCNNANDCKWKKPKDKICSNNQQEQPTVVNPEKCEFKPWGISSDHCVSECHEGEFRDKYGGDLCTKKSCIDICSKCVNTKYCPWLIKKRDERPANVPSAPKNLVAISGDKSAILMWSKPSENGSEILKYKIIFYKKKRT